LRVRIVHMLITKSRGQEVLDLVFRRSVACARTSKDGARVRWWTESEGFPDRQLEIDGYAPIIIGISFEYFGCFALRINVAHAAQNGRGHRGAPRIHIRGDQCQREHAVVRHSGIFTREHPFVLCDPSIATIDNISRNDSDAARRGHRVYACGHGGGREHPRSHVFEICNLFVVQHDAKFLKVQPLAGPLVDGGRVENAIFRGACRDPVAGTFAYRDNVPRQMFRAFGVEGGGCPQFVAKWTNRIMQFGTITQPGDDPFWPARGGGGGGGRGLWLK